MACGLVPCYTRASGLRGLVVCPPLAFFAGSVLAQLLTAPDTFSAATGILVTLALGTVAVHRGGAHRGHRARPRLAARAARDRRARRPARGAEGPPAARLTSGSGGGTAAVARQAREGAGPPRPLPRLASGSRSSRGRSAESAGDGASRPGGTRARRVRWCAARAGAERHVLLDRLDFLHVAEPVTGQLVQHRGDQLFRHRGPAGHADRGHAVQPALVDLPGVIDQVGGRVP